MEIVLMKKIKYIISVILSLVFCFTGCADPSTGTGNGDDGKQESRYDYLSQLQDDYDYDFVPRFMDELLEEVEKEETPYSPQPYPTGVDIGDTLYKESAVYDFWTLDPAGNTGRDGTKGWYTAQSISTSKLPTLVENNGVRYLEFTDAAQLELFYLRTSTKNTYHIFDSKNAWSNLTAQDELFGQEFLFEFEIAANGPYVLGVSDFRTVPETYLDTSKLYGINFLFDGNKISMSRYSSGNEEVIGTMQEGFNFCDGEHHLITFAMSRTSLDNGTIRMFVDRQQVELKETEFHGINTNHSEYGGGSVKKGVIYLSDASAYGQRFSVIPQTKDGTKSVVEIYDYNRVWVGKSELPWPDDVDDDNTFDPAQYPTGANYGAKLKKGNVGYSFWDVDPSGNSGRDGTKGWYTAKAISSSTLPTLYAGADKYLEFSNPAQIELFHLEGANSTYHVFDNKNAWTSADAQMLFGQEFVYELTVSATQSFVLGLTDFGQAPAKFLDKTTSGVLCGIHFLFEGNTIKMTRYNSGKVEAVAALASTVDFGDGEERKISFGITRQDISNGRIRIFVDETLCVFTATTDYGAANSSGGSVVDGVMYFPDAYVYGQRFSVIPQADGSGELGKVYIHDFNRIKVGASQDEVPETKSYTVSLSEGLKFVDGTVTKTLEEGDMIPTIERGGSFSSVYDKNTNTVLVFDNVSGSAVMPSRDLLLAPYTVECGDVCYGFTNSGDMATTGKYVVDQFSDSANSVGNTGDVAVKSNYPIEDEKGDVRLGVRLTYGNQIPVGKNIRVKSPYTIEANETYVAKYTFRNYSANAVKFKIYQVNSGRTITYDGNTFMLDISLASGKSYVGTFEFNFADDKSNTNILNLIVFEEQQTDFDIGFICNVNKKSDVVYDSEYMENLSQLETVLNGKNVSVIGDSISTYRGYSNGAAADTTNDTIRNNADCYKDSWKGGAVKFKDTWWFQAIEQTNMNLLVNNAWSGDTVTSSRFKSGCVNLHDNTGNVSDINPDIIFCYIGINNHSASTSVSDYKTAYDEVIKLMRTKYADAEIYIFTLPPHYGLNNNATKLALLDEYNVAIRQLATENGCNVVDLAANSGITVGNSINYTTDNLHPNLIGMDIITRVVIETLAERYLAQ